MAAPRTEARITTANNVLVMLSNGADSAMTDAFCGSVIDDLDSVPDLTGKSVYLFGDVARASEIQHELKRAARVAVVDAPATVTSGQDYPTAWSNIDAGAVPLLWHGVGVYYRRFFTERVGYFKAIQAEHTFQSLTESTKPQKARRTGLYLTSVERDGDDLHFRLLRCSTNLSGPTESFGTTDTHIVDALNQEAGFIFEDAVPLNHVLAQIYPNTVATADQKQTKAAIKSHADKTKDMPETGIMAFCTFYDQLDLLQPLAADPFDYGYKSTSGLTRLEFRIKESVTAEARAGLPDKFSVTLYPDSVFFVPLSTNRLYTHAIRSSALDASQLPTRLGYVVRCSSAEAVHRDGNTFLKKDGALTKLEPPTPEGVDELRALYAEENRTDAFVDYGGRFDFSMNGGDYDAPSTA